MKSKTTLLTAIACSVVGAILGAGITRYQMNIQHRYQRVILDKIHCYSLIRQIQELDQLNSTGVRHSIERELVIKIFLAERFAKSNDKVGNEARELLKLVSQHRSSPAYIEAEKSFRSAISNN